MIIRYFASKQKRQDIIGAKLIFGRLGLPRRGVSSPDAIGTSSLQTAGGQVLK
jgi:hypothetical protein